MKGNIGIYRAYRAHRKPWHKRSPPYAAVTGFVLLYKPVVCFNCRQSDLKLIYVYISLKIVGNFVWNVQISFISNDLHRSWLFGIICFGSFRFLTLACKHLWSGFITRNNVIIISIIIIVIVSVWNTTHDLMKTILTRFMIMFLCIRIAFYIHNIPFWFWPVSVFILRSSLWPQYPCLLWRDVTWAYFVRYCDNFSTNLKM